MLRRYAVQLFNMDDGRGVDWPMVATTAFRVAMSCLNEVPGDPRAEKVLRRIEGEVYDRLAGNLDGGTASPAAGPATPTLTAEFAPRPGPSPRR